MEKARFRCAVVGAANIDIGGFPTNELIPRDSNPGHISLSSGGVGRNIACNLARLGVEVELIAPLGQDAFADLVRADCKRAGVGLALSPVFEGAASSVYLFIADAEGDMRLAVNDMDICARLTPQALKPCLDALNGMDAVILDANLNEETLAWLAPRLHVPVIADAVSAAKANRLQSTLPWLRVLKPNALEAEALTGIRVTDEVSAWQAARSLIDAGVGRVFITLGENGVCCGDALQCLTLPCPKANLVNATGAGDAFAAALTWAELKDLPLRESALAGLAAAAIAVEARETVSPEMSEQALIARMARIGKED